MSLGLAVSGGVKMGNLAEIDFFQVVKENRKPVPPMSSCTSAPIRSADLIKRLKLQVLELELSVAHLRLDEKNHALDIMMLQRRLDRAEELVLLKDSMLSISSSEHMRFMNLYLAREAAMQTLRETNETLAKKIVELTPAVYNRKPVACVASCCSLPIAPGEKAHLPSSNLPVSLGEKAFLSASNSFLPIGCPAPCSTQAVSKPALSAVVPSPAPAMLELSAPADA
jgi:hypothetical protein